MKKQKVAFIAPILGVASAFAGDVAPVQVQPPAVVENPCCLSPYIGISGVFGEQQIEANNPFLADFYNGEQDYDVTGIRVIGGLGLGNGVSMDGRYEHLNGDSSFDSDEFRAMLNYEREIAQGLSLVGGVGYGWLNHDYSNVDISSSGILLNAGAKFTSGQFFSSLFYTHSFTQSSELEFGNAPKFIVDLDKEDTGFLEATVGYNITEQLAATLAVETQVTGDTLIEKDWVAAIGLQYKF